MISIHPTSPADRRAELFGIDACEFLPTAFSPRLALSCRGDLFGINKGNSESKQESINRAVGVDADTAAVATENSVAAAEDAVAIRAGNDVITGTKQTVGNVSNSDITFGVAGDDLLDLLGRQAAASADTVQVAVEGQGEALSSALDKLSTAVSASQTDGASILTKQIGWIIAAVLGLLASVFIWGKRS